MHTIQVLGPGCQRCQMLLERTRQAIRELGIKNPVEKVSDMGEIVRLGVLTTPALVVDGQVRVSGRVPTITELKEMLA